MVGYDASATQLSGWQHGLAGASSGAVTRLCCQPLDVLKIRFQLQHDPVGWTAPSKYQGVLQAAARIIREEGPAALWKGHVPAQLLSVVYGTVQFTCFEYITRELHRLTADPSSETAVQLHFVGGAAAGLVATVSSLPLDVIRTRLVAQGEPKFYSGMRAAATHMLQHEGVRAFGKGLAPTMLQTAPYTSLQFGAFAIFSRLLGQWRHLQERPSSKALLCGVLAGLTAKTAVYPLDVAKKRLQVQGFQQALRGGGGQAIPQYRGLLHCLYLTASQEGVRGVYKGLAPSSIKAMATTGLHFAFYELAVRMMRDGYATWLR